MSSTATTACPRPFLLLIASAVLVAVRVVINRRLFARPAGSAGLVYHRLKEIDPNNSQGFHILRAQLARTHQVYSLDVEENKTARLSGNSLDLTRKQNTKQKRTAFFDRFSHCSNITSTPSTNPNPTFVFFFHTFHHESSSAFHKPQPESRTP